MIRCSNIVFFVQMRYKYTSIVPPEFGTTHKTEPDLSFFIIALAVFLQMAVKIFVLSRKVVITERTFSKFKIPIDVIQVAFTVTCHIRAFVTAEFF